MDNACDFPIMSFPNLIVEIDQFFDLFFDSNNSDLVAQLMHKSLSIIGELFEELENRLDLLNRRILPDNRYGFPQER